MEKEKFLHVERMHLGSKLESLQQEFQVGATSLAVVLYQPYPVDLHQAALKKPWSRLHSQGIKSSCITSVMGNLLSILTTEIVKFCNDDTTSDLSVSNCLSSLQLLPCPYPRLLCFGLATVAPSCGVANYRGDPERRHSGRRALWEWLHYAEKGKNLRKTVRISSYEFFSGEPPKTSETRVGVSSKVRRVSQESS